MEDKKLLLKEIKENLKSLEGKIIKLNTDVHQMICDFIRRRVNINFYLSPIEMEVIGRDGTVGFKYPYFSILSEKGEKIFGTDITLHYNNKEGLTANVGCCGDFKLSGEGTERDNGQCDKYVLLSILILSQKALTEMLNNINVDVCKEYRKLDSQAIALEREIDKEEEDIKKEKALNSIKLEQLITLKGRANLYSYDYLYKDISARILKITPKYIYILKSNGDSSRLNKDLFLLDIIKQNIILND